MKHKLDATRGRILVVFESTSGLRGLDSSHVKENSWGSYDHRIGLSMHKLRDRCEQ